MVPQELLSENKLPSETLRRGDGNSGVPSDELASRPWRSTVPHELLRELA